MSHRHLILALVLCSPLDHPASANDANWGLDWSGEFRTRYEALDGQYRAGLSGSDQLVALRTLVRADARRGSFGATAELQDSRTYLDDAGTPLSRSFVNTAELLQGYVSWTQSFGADRTVELRAGRFTLDIGSRRQVERNDYRNTINGYTGVHGIVSMGSANLDLIGAVPVRKDPADRQALDRNEQAWDDEESHRKLWAAHGQWPLGKSRWQLDGYLYGFEETDRNAQPTLDRDLLTPGLRIARKPSKGSWDTEVEAAMRLGDRSVSTATDAATVDVRGHMLHASVGYTFDSSWNIRAALELDYASGDDPDSATDTRYERLFGTRRGDLGNTSIHGPLTRSNIVAPGVRLSFKNGGSDGRLLVQFAQLADKQDAWIVARLQDASGRSGREIGTTLDWRVRHRVLRSRVTIEIGGSALRYGSFARRVANGPESRWSIYAYGQVTARW